MADPRVGPRGGATTVTGGGMRRVQVSLDDATISRLDAEAARRDVSRSDVIRSQARQLAESADKLVTQQPL